MESSVFSYLHGIGEVDNAVLIFVKNAGDHFKLLAVREAL